ncbi:hypothetical protein [Methanobrevibacter sp.]|uniref:hypothetical protein n=1 Tax=Methanobrevibacter sp. TaxID=66852 RepID=UPI00388E18B7
MFGKYNIELKNGDQKLAVKYTPAKVDIIVDSEISEELEEMVRGGIGSLYELGSGLIQYGERLSSNELKPLTVFVKAQTKEFFKDNSILSADEVLEVYENFNHNADALIKSLLNDERNLEHELFKVREKIENAKSFKDELNNMDLENENEDDNEIVSSLNENPEDSRVKVDIM